jgi:hypothetical protein
MGAMGTMGTPPKVKMCPEGKRKPGWHHGFTWTYMDLKSKQQQQQEEEEEEEEPFLLSPP